MTEDVLVELDVIRAVVLPRAEIVGWATVDLDRSEQHLRDADADANVGPDVDDEILGARCRTIEASSERVVLLEPSTEGLLAGGLARHGEGPIARYLLADASAIERLRKTTFALSPASSGPFGPQRRVLGGPRDGPFVLIVAPDS
jgi:hypothetical protein